MNDPFVKISENFSVSWDVESLVANCPMISNSGSVVYSEQDGKPHWQYFRSGISFFRNFYINFKDECIETADRLLALQKELSFVEPGHCINEFLSHKIHPARVNLLLIKSGVDVQPHVDITRDICINIGVKNSNVCTTYIRRDFGEDNFWDNDLLNYTMNDGDVYLVSIKNQHAVKQNGNGNGDRYLITYNMINR